MSELEKNLLLMISNWDESIKQTLRDGHVSVEEEHIIATITECKRDIIKCIKESRIKSLKN